MNEVIDKLEDRKTGKYVLTFFATIFLMIGVSVLFFFTVKVVTTHSFSEESNIVSLSKFGTYGDFIGGAVGTLFSLAGFFILFLTLKEQRENFHRERLESTFYELIKLHRENVSEMQYSYYETKVDDSKKIQKVTAEKRKVFKIIFTQFKEAWEELSHIFIDSSIEDIYEKEYLAKIRLNKVIQERKINLKQLAQIDIIYLIIFFGLSKEDQQNILNLTKNRYDSTFVNKIIKFASLKPKRESKYWRNWDVLKKLNRSDLLNDILNKRENKPYNYIIDNSWIDEGYTVYPFEIYYRDNYIKYYGGQQFRLGHYFRHIYQTVKFIDNEESLSTDEKYNFIKILRGQLSNYEQIIFFLNSISEVGRTWELMMKNKPNELIKKEKQLITKYNLIKNIPMQHIANDIDILDYYPNLNYEAIINRTTKTV